MCLIFLLKLFKQFYYHWVADNLQEGNQKIFQRKCECIAFRLFIMCYFTFVMTFKLNYLTG